MSVKQTDPLETNDILQKDKTAAYVDVRTVQEFQAGHVPGAANIPVMIPDPSIGPNDAKPEFRAGHRSRVSKGQEIDPGMPGRGPFTVCRRFAGQGRISRMSRTCRADLAERRIPWAALSHRAGCNAICRWRCESSLKIVGGFGSNELPSKSYRKYT